MEFKRYRKAVVGAAGVLVVVGEALRDAQVDSGEAFNIALALAVAFGVYRVPNKIQ